MKIVIQTEIQGGHIEVFKRSELGRDFYTIDLIQEQQDPSTFKIDASIEMDTAQLEEVIRSLTEIIK